MLPEARERAVLLTDVHTELHLDLTSADDFGVEATISFRCTRAGGLDVPRAQRRPPT